ncbi:MAG: sulfite reductase subunit alpha [Burkholderiaceae bacterium]
MNPGWPEAARLAAAAGVAAAYLGMCAAIALRQRRGRAAARREARGFEQAGDGAAPVLVAYASQTGHARQIARQSARALHDAGVAVRFEPLGALTPAALARATTALFVVGTCGEGDAPDDAAGFVRRFMAQAPAGSGGAPGPFAGLGIGVLALGDREFAQFAAFGRRLDGWLRAGGARPLFDRIDVDGAGAEALARWRHELGRLASVADTLAWVDDAPRPWRLAARRRLNPGSVGGPVFLLDLEAVGDGGASSWEAGDLARIQVPDPKARPRDYSIASVADDGRVQLLVRRRRDARGRPGLASGWLTCELPIGGEVALTLVAHRNFRLGENAPRPLILIGNGTGIAGLRSHLRAGAAASNRRRWLIFGERQAAHDFHFEDEVLAWRASGALERVDLAFSRDQPAKRYVQDCLLEQAPTVRGWIADGAAIYLCGSLDGMAAGVHGALVEILGARGVERLVDEGRLRRDVY